jgi:hypothetical protein
MATQVVAVHTVKPYGYSHEHISHVRTADGRTLTRETVIQRIYNGWEAFYTLVSGYRADVVVRGCPYCGAGDYITTLPDSNNLLSLPRF